MRPDNFSIMLRFLPKFKINISDFYEEFAEYLKDQSGKSAVDLIHGHRDFMWNTKSNSEDLKAALNTLILENKETVQNHLPLLIQISFGNSMEYSSEARDFLSDAIIGTDTFSSDFKHSLNVIKTKIRVISWFGEI